MNSIRSFSFVALLFLIIAGCSQTSTLTDGNSPNNESPPEYSLIFYIHGDSDYLFHFGDGTPSQADEQALLKAINVAEQAENGEVFIFHQRPEKKRVWIFPRKTNEMIHYRNGEIINHISYRHSYNQEQFMIEEAGFYQEYRSKNLTDNHPKHFAYFGHEIPDVKGEGYHSTKPEVDVNTTSFVSGIQEFLISDSERFNLVVLSTCNNGTPAMANELVPVANYLIASPQDLHLSHLDIEQFSTLEENHRPPTFETASSIARDSFNRLAESVQTTVTVAIYNLNLVKVYIDELYQKVKSYEEAEQPESFRDNIDCKDLSFIENGKYETGVETFFRPARFGVRSRNQTHSGWGCKGNTP